MVEALQAKWDSELICPPILFTIFNRPLLTKRVFECIRFARPQRLFIAADGPRPGKEGEEKRCAETREIVKQIDWDCEVSTLQHDQNLGCKIAMSSAINWFFDHVEAGIILEDDCVPNPTFFPYCQELLGYYRDDKRVMMISGDNFQKNNAKCQYSYYFSVFSHIWGWATWRRAWKNYDVEMKLWPELRDTTWMVDILNENSALFWRSIFDLVYAGKIDTWDYQWAFCNWVQHGLTILPCANLVSNIGFGDSATHTTDQNSSINHLPVIPMKFPIQHPPCMIRDRNADLYTARAMFSNITGPRKFIKKAIKILLPGTK
jgi:hypothetical protein